MKYKGNGQNADENINSWAAMGNQTTKASKARSTEPILMTQPSPQDIERAEEVRRAWYDPKDDRGLRDLIASALAAEREQLDEQLKRGELAEKQVQSLLANERSLLVESARLREALSEIGREQSAVSATAAADRFQEIARATLNAGEAPGPSTFAANVTTRASASGRGQPAPATPRPIREILDPDNKQPTCPCGQDWDRCAKPNC